MQQDASLHGIKDDNRRIKPVSVKKQSIWYTELDGANIRKKETMSMSLSSLMIPNALKGKISNEKIISLSLDLFIDVTKET